MALKDFIGKAVPVVHSVSETVAPLLAFFALAGTRPAAVAERLETSFPNPVEIVLVYAALTETVAVDVGAGTDPAVDKNRRYVDSGMAEVSHLTHLFLIAAKISFAAESDVHGPFGRPLALDEVH